MSDNFLLINDTDFLLINDTDRLIISVDPATSNTAQTIGFGDVKADDIIPLEETKV